MNILVNLTNILGRINAALLYCGRGIGAFAMAVMVLAILIQVVFRYGFNNALPWPDEAARFCMLWMVGLVAPTALRRGGFVAIDMFPRALPHGVGQVLNLLLLGVGLLVLVVAVQIGWGEVTGFGGRFKTASLYLPTSITFDSWFRIPRSWMMMSFFVCVVLLLMVTIELILRSIAKLFGREDGLITIPEASTVGAE